MFRRNSFEICWPMCHVWCHMQSQMSYGHYKESLPLNKGCHASIAIVHLRRHETLIYWLFGHSFLPTIDKVTGSWLVQPRKHVDWTIAFCLLTLFKSVTYILDSNLAIPETKTSSMAALKVAKMTANDWNFVKMAFPLQRLVPRAGASIDTTVTRKLDTLSSFQSPFGHSIRIQNIFSGKMHVKISFAKWWVFGSSVYWSILTPVCIRSCSSYKIWKLSPVVFSSPNSACLN